METLSHGTLKRANLHRIVRGRARRGIDRDRIIDMPTAVSFKQGSL
jgi:hypothetical protein